VRPEPRVRAGLLLGRNRVASACIDLSDGLADGVRQVAAASQVGVRLDAGALPIPDEVREWHERRGDDLLRAALAGGDDYELLFTVRPAHRGRLRGMLRVVGDLPITRIGVVTKERRLSVTTPQGEQELPGGFQHFQ
jgi:thiamine-monophosphate kinase